MQVVEETCLTENAVTALALPYLLQWLERHYEVEALATYTERVTCDGGRADGLVVGMYGSQETITIALESKSRTTIEQLVGRYQSNKHMLEAGGVGIAGAFVHPLVGAVLFGIDLAFRRAAYTDIDAALQAMSYPGDLRILALPDDTLEDFPEVRRELREVCESLGLGLIRVRPDGSVSWLVKPEEIERDDEDGEWLDDYLTADAIRAELEEVLETAEEE